MKDESYTAVVCAVFYGCEDNEEDDVNKVELLDHIREIFDITRTKHERLLTKCLYMKRYQLQVVAHLPSRETMMLYILDGERCKQYAIKTGEIYVFDVGCRTNIKLKFDVIRPTDKSYRTTVRSGSLLKRIMMLERKEYDHVNLATLPVNTLVKKSIFLRGHQHTVDLKVLENINCEIMAGLDFDDLLEVTTMLHEYDAERTSGKYTGELSGKSSALLRHVAHFSHIPPEIITIVSLSVFLVWDNTQVCLDDMAITRLIKLLDAQQNFERCDILETALCHLAECLVAEIHDILQQFSHSPFFPPNDYLCLKNMNTALKHAVTICILRVWDVCNSQHPSSILTEQLVSMIVECAEEWMYQEFRPHLKDVKEFCITIQTMWEMMQRNHLSYNLFFQQFNVNYVEVALRTIDEKLELFGRSYLSERLMQLDSRQTSQLEIFTKCTMRFYDTLHSLVRLGRENNVEKLLIYDFETWFLDVIVFWTYSWRDVSLKMVTRTISLDNDGDASKYEHRPLPAGLYSFLCIQKGLSDDYSMLAFELSRNMLMGSISLVQILSENIYAYAKKLHNDAMSNDSDMALLFVSERWRRFVDFDRMATVLPIEEMAVVERFCTKVLDSTRKNCELIMDQLLRIYCRSLGDNIMRIARTVTVENNEHSKKLTMYVRNPAERMYRIMDNVDRLACNACSDLLSSCSQIALRIIHEMLETEILRCLRDSRNPEYYSEIYITLKEIINVLGVSLESSKATPLLYLHSFTTNELILSYYAQIIEEMNVKQEGSVPHINIQVGYLLASDDNALIIVNVLGLYNVLELNTLCDRVEPFVKLELLPVSLYPPHCFPVQKTKTTHYENLSWSQEFHFLVPLQLFYLRGSSLCVSVLDHDRINDNLIGQTLLATSQFPRMNSFSMKNLPPAQALHLVEPLVGDHLPYYKMLKKRSPYDKVAQAFLRREKGANGMYLRAHSRKFPSRRKSLKERSI